jgi:hypothetical protein
MREAALNATPAGYQNGLRRSVPAQEMRSRVTRKSKCWEGPVNKPLVEESPYVTIQF